VIDESGLRAESAQIARLLEELREMLTPPALQRLDQLLRRIVALYGAGLAHLLEHARASGSVGETLDRLATEDELLASLLVLHGLHPLTAEVRILRVLELVRAELGLAEHGLELVDLTEGTVRLQARVALGGGSMSSRVAEGIIRRAIEAAAPEVTAVEIAGVPILRDPGLVQIRVRREAT
jgi:hypothetical protein